VAERGYGVLEIEEHMLGGFVQYFDGLWETWNRDFRWEGRNRLVEFDG